MQPRKKKEKPEKEKTSRLMNVFESLLRFLGKRYVWSGLLLGFIWSFSTPFILTTFQGTWQQLPQEAINVLFFPMVLAFHILYSLAGQETYINPILLWGLSIFIGIITGVITTYCLHLIRVSLKTKKPNAQARDVSFT